MSVVFTGSAGAPSRYDAANWQRGKSRRSQ